MTAATDDLASDLVDLVRRIRAGELRAETELVARYLPAARAITRRDCRAYEAAVDETLCRTCLQGSASVPGSAGVPAGIA